MNLLWAISQLGYFRHKVLSVLLIYDFWIAVLVLLLSIFLSVSPIHNRLVVVSATLKAVFQVILR